MVVTRVYDTILNGFFIYHGSTVKYSFKEERMLNAQVISIGIIIIIRFIVKMFVDTWPLHPYALVENPMLYYIHASEKHQGLSIKGLEL